MTFLKRRSNVLFNVLTILSQRDVPLHCTAWSGEKEQKNCSKKDKLPKANPTNNQGWRETGQVSFFHLTWELSTYAECMDLRVFSWSSGCLGSEIMDEMCEACILLRKVSNKSNSTVFRKSLSQGHSGKVVEGNGWKSGHVRTCFLLYSFVSLLSSLCSKVVFEVFYRWMHSFQNANYLARWLHIWINLSKKQRRVIAFLSIWSQ